MFLAVLISVLVLAAFSAAILITARNARKRQAAVSVPLDLGGRFPARGRRPCGRHGDGNCEDCDNKHHHHDDHHHDHDCEGHCHGRGH